MVRPVPIFVLGLQRSGTTWIGNLLAAHDRVAAVAAPRHRGIHESLFFSHFARAWDWSDPGQRAAALRAFLDSDYGRLAALDLWQEGHLMTIATPADAFRFMMECIAAREDGLAWVEKSPHHMRHAEEIARALPDARFAVIRRDSVSLMASRRQAYGRRPSRGARDLWGLVRGAVANAYYGKLLARFAARYPDRVVMLDYADFKRGGDRAVARLLSDLGLPPQHGLAPAFAANSSHARPDSGGHALGSTRRRLIRVCDAAASALPFPVLDGLRRGVARDNVDFPAWTWPDGAPALPVPTGSAALAPLTARKEIPCQD